MSSEKNTKKNDGGSAFGWILLIIAIIVGLYLYLKSRWQVKGANEELNDHLEERKTALNEIYANVGFYRKRKIEIVHEKRRTTVFLRFLTSVIILILNGAYVAYCYPDSITLQLIFECIATFNAALLFLTGIITFAVFGSFFEIKTVYHQVQTFTLTFLFKDSEEKIESLLKLDLENRESIRMEISETEQAIKQNEELLNPTPIPEPQEGVVVLPPQNN